MKKMSLKLITEDPFFSQASILVLLTCMMLGLCVTAFIHTVPITPIGTWISECKPDSPEVTTIAKQTKIVVAEQDVVQYSYTYSDLKCTEPMNMLAVKRHFTKKGHDYFHDKITKMTAIGYDDWAVETMNVFSFLGIHNWKINQERNVGNGPMMNALMDIKVPAVNTRELWTFQVVKDDLILGIVGHKSKTTYHQQKDSR